MNGNIKEQLDSVIDIFNKLKSDSSMNNKIGIIKKNKDNETFISILRFVFDDFVRSGVSSKTLRSANLPYVFLKQAVYTIDAMLEYIKENNTGSFETIAQMQAFIAPFNEEEQSFLIDVFSKELKAGVTAKTINKALGKEFIREFSVQLAYPFHKYPDKVTGNEFIVTQKLDGHRAICIVDGDEGTFYTRKGLVIPGLGRQIYEAVSLVGNGYYGQPMVLDGELLLDPYLYSEMKTKDLFRATSRTLRSETADKGDIIYNVFDALPLDEFMAGRSTQVFKDRKMGLYGAFEKTFDDEINSRLRLVKNLYDGRDIGMIKALEKEYVDNFGWEGLMLNLANGHYETKRTNNLLKVKEFFDADVICTDLFEGTGRLHGTLGGIIVNYKGYSIKVGSGFTDEERERYWNDPDQIIGQVVAISYFEETHNQNNDDLSLRFPTYLSSRIGEKDATDVSYEV